MKVLWIVNNPMGPVSEHLFRKKYTGLWVGPLLDCFAADPAYKMIVATTAAVNEPLKIEENGVIFYALPDAPPIMYQENKESNIAHWKRLINDERPDLIQAWGTEFTHGLCALRAAGDIPSVVYMQGYLGSIARHYLAGMTHSELRRTVTFRDRIKRDSIVQQQKKYQRSTLKEKEMLELSGNAICENDWCENSLRTVVPDLNIYRCPLNLSRAFMQKTWDLSQAEPHSIICNASGYPLKGLHMLLRAVRMLKKKFPDVRLYVPGSKVVTDGSIQWALRKRGYSCFIEQLIREYDLKDQVVWLGSMQQEELAKYYAKTRVFVLCSAIENHSSSLKEAMMVGTPSVASAVGGVPEYVVHGKTAFLYRFEEYDIMSTYIEKLFVDDALAQQMSKNAKESMRSLHSEQEIYQIMTDVMKQITKD